VKNRHLLPFGIIFLACLPLWALLRLPRSQPALAAMPAAGLSCSGGATPLTLWSDNLESGAGNWQPGGLTTTWGLASFRRHDGFFAYRATALAVPSDQWAQLPAMVLPPAGMGPIQFRFWNWQALEDGPHGCFDGGFLEYSLDGGAQWQVFTATQLLTDPYDGPISPDYNNPAAGYDAWCGDPQDWLEAVVDLSALAGETVNLRFRLATDENNGREGWYLDTLSLDACLPASGYGARLTPALSQRTVAPGELITHTFVLENLGQTETFNVALSGASWPTTVTSGGSLLVPAGLTGTITVQVTPPLMAASDTFTLTVSSSHDPGHVTMVAAGQTNGAYFSHLPIIIAPK
jgi:hypothetical protein